MFDEKRYITRGANETICLDLQLILWNLIDDLKKDHKIELDYLQVFNLKKEIIDDIQVQKIEHKQEVPGYKKELLFNVSKPIEVKVFVIDSGKYSTMMLAEEY